MAIDGSARALEVASSTDPAATRSVHVYARDANQEKLIWNAPLVNLPGRFFVAPSGRAVVTMDLWCGSGTDALVFYGPSGKLVKRYEQAEGVLIFPSESAWVERSVSSYWWSRGSFGQFTAGGEFFWLWFPWGRVMIFEASTGEIVDEKAIRLDMERGRGMILSTAQVLAKSAEPRDRIAAARLAGWLKGEAAGPVLKGLLRDPYYEDDHLLQPEGDTWGRLKGSYSYTFIRRYPVRRAAAEEIHMAFGQADAVVEERVLR
ncbi:MAG: hypothetical protein U0R19_40475 [Bryobacteraceae bacterium]